MRAIVFAGPTLTEAVVHRHLDAEVRPPVAQGDVYRAVCDGALRIGIVDGYFERVPSVWHKEILWALSRGAAVYGAASMGALRAAELADYGMIGVGVVFEAYRDGELEDDDEVAVAHSSSEAGYRVSSEAMVNIRASLHRAWGRGVLAPSTHEALISIAKAMFYADRSYRALLLEASARGLPKAELATLGDWLKTNAVNQKQQDAVAMLQRMSVDPEDRRVPAPSPELFEPTNAWDRAIREMPEPTQTQPSAIDLDDSSHGLEAMLGEELALFGPYALIRGLRKRELFADGSPRVSPEFEEIAITWYFAQRLGRTVPVSLATYSHEIGMRDEAAFRAAVVVEYRYVTMTGVSSDGAKRPPR